MEPRNGVLKAFEFRRGLIFSFVAIGIVAAMIIFPLRSVTYLKRHERMKPVAARINAAVPPGEHLYAINLPFLPYLFYVRCPVTYLEKLADLPDRKSVV